MKKTIIDLLYPYSGPSPIVDVEVYSIPQKCNVYLVDLLSGELSQCYISGTKLQTQQLRTGLSIREILKSVFPDRGSVMAGDFGEIFTLNYLSDYAHSEVHKVYKWRYKQDRNKPAPHTDVIVIFRDSDDTASANDYVLSAEAKVKSTNGNFSPIEASIEGAANDKTGRLARTLVWLKEQAIKHENKETIEYISRFTDQLLETSFKKKYRAVSLIDMNYIGQELAKDICVPEISDDFRVIAFGIHNLKQLYEETYSSPVEQDLHE
ncbi:Hachiman antiphage defense system protein HamA [Salinispira pacifica]|uniref:Anti-bacteriophage protein A/HamA C-terminal domain-containing protein n=1 Tax=Salinispira pacifica TaxID=1307761 RepID=V5WK23_9SPIO|nr:Hachiman antiphage defense system protein HamA [Salinispira pacifica]AHC16000.1 hypothetical protein L21SP2_2648 [Salinispira pacifica]